MSRPVAHYQPTTGFHEDLRRRVDAYFAETGLSRRDDPGMVLKTAVILAGIAGFYALLVFWAASPGSALPCAVGLAVSIGGLGFSIAHDGNHGAYSDRPALNRLMGAGYDAIGASSYIWRWKHNQLHHSFPNIPELDEDINRYPLFRLTPGQTRLPAHRLQFLYAWALYGLLVIKWQLVSDFRDLYRGKTGEHVFEPPDFRDIAIFWAGKAAFVLWAFIVPSLFHPFSHVLAFYVFTSVVLSLIMSTVFQIAHCFEDAGSASFDPETRAIDREWARHQIESCADFGRGNRLLSWYVGGLNFQTEHHLFPAVCHVHYPALARIVEAACAEHGVKYTAFGSLRAGVASHGRWLYRLGREG
jgi:linoleoyl-CoA desaturase